MRTDMSLSTKGQSYADDAHRKKQTAERMERTEMQNNRVFTMLYLNSKAISNGT